LRGRVNNKNNLDPLHMFALLKASVKTSPFERRLRPPVRPGVGSGDANA
jgi:hypothetical protein